MKFISGGLAVVCAATLICVAVLRQRSQTPVSAAGKDRGPVIVELFTSEGCSSCPPADAALAKLEQDPATVDAQVIGLEEHVDYWNQLGWADPFSSPDWTSRQREYAEVFGSGSVYTPQMVVDGTTELVGSRGPEVRRSIEQAAGRVKTAISIAANEGETAGARKFDVRVGKLAGAETRDEAEVWLAVTESGLHSSVTRGENAGEELKHASVVRSLQKLGVADKHSEASFARQLGVPVNSSWKRENLRVVVFVQEKKSRHILGASAVPFTNGTAAR
jgi:hypothetical protein